MASKWDIRFLQLARHVSTWSRDPSTRAGAIITHPNKTVLSLGFNGFPQNMRDDAELYADRETKLSKIIHCEVNALILAEGSARGCCLYTWPLASCDRCCVQMLQAGIVRFVYPSIPESLVERWGASLAKSMAYIAEAGCEAVEVPSSEILPVILS